VGSRSKLGLAGSAMQSIRFFAHVVQLIALVGRPPNGSQLLHVLPFQ
jgi:hypothetical protein